MDQLDRTRNAEHDAIPGEVVPADEESDDTSATSSSEDSYPQTYLHKVASGRSASDTAAEETEEEDEPILGRTGTAAGSPAGEPPEDRAIDDRTDEYPFGRETRDEAAAAQGDIPTIPDVPEVASPAEPAAPGTATDETAGTPGFETDPAPSGLGRDTATVADVPAARTDPDLLPPDAMSADDQRGRHRAAEPVTEPVPDVADSHDKRPGDEPIPPGLDGNLLPDSAGIREQWLQIQARFVDDPRASVSDAASIITDVVSRLETAVRERQDVLRARWDGNSKADTEALRVTMQQYRHLLERLAGF